MGWVVLTLRKTELKRTHADYQMELLQISRQKRQMARQYHYQQSVARNQQQAALRDLREGYNANKETIYAGGTPTSLSSENTSTGSFFDGYNSGSNSATEVGFTANLQDNATSSSSSSSSSSSRSYGQLTALQQNQLDDARLEYQEEVNAIKTYWEDKLAMIEEEANDTETDLDQQQVEIEAQLEAISAEIEAVGQAVSSQIQASTIKLS